MPYSLAIFWHERQRFLPAVLAVAFSALLIALQCGLLLGIFSITSLPVDSTSADLWLGGPGILSVDQGTPIPATYLASLARQPEVEHCEIYVKGLASWVKPDARGSELCMVIGTRLAGDALGAVRKIDLATRYLLTEPGAIIIDKTELGRLGVGGSETGRRSMAVAFASSHSWKDSRASPHLTSIVPSRRLGSCCICRPIRRLTCWPAVITPQTRQSLPSACGAIPMCRSLPPRNSRGGRACTGC